MKRYGVKASEFFKAPPDDDDAPCDVCAITVQANDYDPLMEPDGQLGSIACPYCGSAVMSWKDANIAVVQETNTSDPNQYVVAVPIVECHNCKPYARHFALYPTPIIYNANHDIYYTGGSTYVPVNWDDSERVEWKKDARAFVEMFKNVEQRSDILTLQLERLIEEAVAASLRRMGYKP